MTTRFVGIKEFRQNMAQLALKARKNNERLVILRKNEPIFELRPLSKKDATLEALMRDIEEAREDVRAGRVYSLEEVQKSLGL